MTMCSRAFLLLLACTAAPALARTDVELDIEMLSYADRETKADLDNLTVKGEHTALASVDPSFALDVYADRLWIDFSIERGDADDQAGTLTAGYEVSPGLFVGALLGIEQTKDKSSTKATGVATGKVETEDQSNSLALGPIVHFRSKTASSLLEADGGLIHVDGKTKEDDGTTETTTSFKIMALAASVDYYLKIADRFFVGAGASYVLGMSGDISQDSGATSEDGDYDYSELTVNLLEARVEI
jgi:hypothetical protein